LTNALVRRALGSGPADRFRRQLAGIGRANEKGLICRA
jgi:hypothetical protein